MCGIVGITGNFSNSDLVKATASLNHRGPDDSGTYINTEHKIGLGHTRLSIIDLSPLGHQPMISSDESVVLVFNGEIYNFLDLRDGLKQKGYRFKGSSDTEVVLNMYLEYGIECLSYFNGIFGLAIFDQRSNNLYLARDALGVKPVYYHQDNSNVVFSSEIKALLHLIKNNLEIDYESIQKYLTYLWCPGDGTPVTSIKKVLPGEVLTINDGQIVSKKSWYRLPQTKLLSKIKTAENAVHQLSKALSNAVHRQLIADVPVGSFLSGGLDSSAVVALAKNHVKDLNCFTIEPIGGSDEDVAEDLPYAIKVAKHLGVNLEVVKINSEELVKDLEEMVWMLDEPLADPAPLNVLYISKLARKNGMKVLLSGSGGDDLFTGYRRHLAVNYEKLWSWLPQYTRKKMETFSLKTDQNKSFGRRLSKLFNNAGSNGDERLASYFAWARRSDLEPLFSDEMKNAVKNINPDKPFIDFLKNVDSRLNPIEKILSLEQRFFLADHNLIYTDKMSMAAGIEVRVPFLDLELVNLSARIPDKYKQKGTTGKWILKKAMEEYLPHEVIYRPKTGFGAPIRRWIKNDLRSLVDDLLSEESIKNRGIFNHLEVKKLIKNNQLGIRDYSYTIFSLLTIEIWCRKFIDNQI